MTVAALIVANPVGSVFDPRTGLPWGIGTDGAEFFGLRAPSAGAGRRGERPRREEHRRSTPRSGSSPPTPHCPRRRAGASRPPATTGWPGRSGRRTRRSTATRCSRSPPGRCRCRRRTRRRRPSSPTDLPSPRRCARRRPICVERAVVDAVLTATSVAGIPAYRELLSTAMRGREPTATRGYERGRLLGVGDQGGPRRRDGGACACRSSRRGMRDHRRPGGLRPSGTACGDDQRGTLADVLPLRFGRTAEGVAADGRRRRGARRHLPLAHRDRGVPEPHRRLATRPNPTPTTS